MKKMLALIMSLLLVCSLSLACAEGDALQVIMNVGTTQAFTDEAVPDEDIETIVQAGLAAASAINQQPWHFAVITNAEVMAEIAGGSAMPAGMTPAADGEEAASSGASSSAPAASASAKAALGDSPVAIVLYMNEGTASPNASFDCGLACQNMVIAASSLGYGAKIVSSPSITLNGENHDALCEKLGVDPAYQAVAVLLIGHEDTADTSTSASVRSTMAEKVSFVK